MIRIQGVPAGGYLAVAKGRLIKGSSLHASIQGVLSSIPLTDGLHLDYQALVNVAAELGMNTEGGPNV